jgi:hypothetical protein
MEWKQMTWSPREIVRRARDVRSQEAREPSRCPSGRMRLSRCPRIFNVTPSPQYEINNIGRVRNGFAHFNKSPPLPSPPRGPFLPLCI